MFVCKENSNNEEWERVMSLVIEYIEHTPKIEELKWIPCSERLPEDVNKVLTCDAYGNIHVNWHYRGYEVPFCIYENDPRYYPVVAWMPLPKPYQSE